MRHRLRIHRAIVLSLVLASACASLPPKVLIDKADRAAFNAVQAFQVAEGAAWHARAPWPTPEQHRAVNQKISEAYQLIVDVAGVGLALPPGSKLSAADLAALSKLTAVVRDFIALTQLADTAVKQAAGEARDKVKVLVDSIGGAH